MKDMQESRGERCRRDLPLLPRANLQVAKNIPRIFPQIFQGFFPKIIQEQTYRFPKIVQYFQKIFQGFFPKIIQEQTYRFLKIVQYFQKIFQGVFQYIPKLRYSKSKPTGSQNIHGTSLSKTNTSHKLQLP